MRFTEEEKRLFNKIYEGQAFIRSGDKKWNDPLNNHAREENKFSPKIVNRGDFVSLDDGKTWWEILQSSTDYLFEDDDKWLNMNEWHVSPVDEFGNELTAEEILAKFPKDGKDYVENLRCYDYADRWSYCLQDEDDWTFPFLIVHVDHKYDKDIHNSYGSISKDEFPFEFDYTDDWGRPIATDEFLKDHPDYDYEDYPVHWDDRKTYSVPRAGTPEARANFKKAYNDYYKKRDDVAARREKRLHSGILNGWKLNEKMFLELQPNLKEEAKEKAVRNMQWYINDIEDPMVPYYKKDPCDFDRIGDFRKWIKEVGGDVSVVNDVLGAANDFYKQLRR